jgi:hypothetical protein
MRRGGEDLRLGVVEEAVVCKVRAALAKMSIVAFPWARGMGRLWHLRRSGIEEDDVKSLQSLALPGFRYYRECVRYPIP